MKHLMLILCLLAGPSLMATPVLAVEPDEILDDPLLEARAREMSQELRCLVCRNESIDESNADLARDLRLLVRERLLLGESNTEVMDFIVARYGEFVLLRPTKTGANLVLWVAGPVTLLLALGFGGLYLRRRGQGPGPDALDQGEKDRLKEILQG